MTQSNVRRSGGRRVQQKKTNSNRTLIIAAVVGVVLIMAAAGLALSRNSGGNIAGQQQFPNLVPPPASPHIAEVTSPHGPYNSNPPTSGWHYGGGTAPWGVQTQPVADELSVHNLEHGGVIIHYRQGLDQATVDQLTALTRDLGTHSLPHRILMYVWKRIWYYYACRMPSAVVSVTHHPSPGTRHASPKT